MRSRAYRAAASANLADGFAALGVRGAIVPLFVRDVLHRSAVWTGIGFLVFAALNGGALLPGGRVADILGRRPVIVAGCAISAVGMVMLALLPGLCALPGRAGRGRLRLGPAGRGPGGDDRRHHRQAAAGPWSRPTRWPATSAPSSGPWPAGFLVDSASYAAAFGLAAAVLGGAAVLGFVSPETRPGGEAWTLAVPAAGGPDSEGSQMRPALSRRPEPHPPACRIRQLWLPGGVMG